MKKKERKCIKKKDIIKNSLYILILYKQILASVNLLIWTLVSTNSEWSNISYSTYGQTGSKKHIYYENFWFETERAIIILYLQY